MILTDKLSDGTKVWRYVLDIGIMTNNEQYVFYADRLVDDDLLNKMEQRLGELVRIACERPVFAEEGIYISYSGRPEKEILKNQDLTRMLDAWFVMRAKLPRYMEIEKDKSKALAVFVALRYYDCMSGGMPVSEIRITRELLKTGKINLDEEVYPNHSEAKKWDTFRDFLRETDDLDRGPRLPFPAGLDSEFPILA